MSAVAKKTWLSPPQVAELLGVAHDKVLRFVREGELRAVDLSTHRGKRPRWHISREDLDKFLARRSNSPPPKPRRRRKQNHNDNVIEFYK